MTIDLEFKEFKQRIEQFEYEMPKIAKKMMTAALVRARSYAKKIAQNRFHKADYTGRNKPPGQLLRAINYWAFDDWVGALTTRKSAKTNNCFYASILEDGTTILPKKGKYLFFRINGQLRKVPSVTIRPRPFMRPAFDDFFVKSGGSKAMVIMDKRLQKEMDRILEGKT
ncbi:MAG: hypothetical protein LBU17_01690 [Treponema sp.]|jgi:hypothetical protein|nr:hypothetical protein [Treponema sp.]